MTHLKQSVHVEDEVAPVDDEYRPARQSSHVEDEVAPTVVLYLPLGKWGGVWGVLARIEEIGDAATHLAHSVQPLKLNGDPETVP